VRAVTELAVPANYGARYSQWPTWALDDPPASRLAIAKSVQNP
jgi:hypothetical protein